MTYDSYKIILDVPCDDPGLGFGNYAKALCSTIQSSDPHFSIGIFGGWGAGKSTLMNRMMRELSLDSCVMVDFSAWRYEKEEHLIVPLLDSIRDSLNEWATSQPAFQASVNQLTSTIGKVTKSLLCGFSLKAKIPEVLDISFDANKAISQADAMDAAEAQRLAPRSFYFAAFAALRASFQQFWADSGNKRIVVFIDDLDRCLPEGALEILESMKLFFDFDGFVFVVGLDQAVVEWCIDNRYAEFQKDEDDTGYRIRGADYIKKIFQVPFTLPPVAGNQVESLIQAVIASNNLPADQEVDLQNRVAPHLEHLLIASGGLNMRDLKRLLNSYILIMKIRPSLDPDIVLVMQTLAFAPEWQEIYEALRIHGDDLTAQLRNMIGDQQDVLNEVAPELSRIPVSFERYIREDMPGNCLIRRTDESITDYIALSSSTSASDREVGSSYDYAIVEILRAISDARRSLSQDNFRAVHDSFGTVSKHASEFYGMAGGRRLQDACELVRSTTAALESTTHDESDVDKVTSQIDDASALVQEIKTGLRFR